MGKEQEKDEKEQAKDEIHNHFAKTPNRVIRSMRPFKSLLPQKSRTTLCSRQ